MPNLTLKLCKNYKKGPYESKNQIRTKNKYYSILVHITHSHFNYFGPKIPQAHSLAHLTHKTVLNNPPVKPSLTKPPSPPKPPRNLQNHPHPPPPLATKPSSPSHTPLHLISPQQLMPPPSCNSSPKNSQTSFPAKKTRGIKSDPMVVIQSGI